MRLIASSLVLLGAALCAACPPPEPQPPAPTNTTPLATQAPSVRPAASPPATVDVHDVGVPLPPESECARNPDGTYTEPLDKTYVGLLRNAKCVRQKFLTMSNIADALDVKCSHCHVPLPGPPNQYDFPAMTEKKEIANWMGDTFIHGLLGTDGQAMLCAHCHATPTGAPIPRILGDPRDTGYAQEWMHEIMTAHFVQANGDRLRCKTCHVGMAPGQSDWQAHVIRELRRGLQGLERADGRAGQ